MKQEHMIIGAIVLIGLFIFMSNGTKKEAILSSTYNQNSDCSLITNVDPINLPYSDYTGSAAWVAVNYDGDAVMEAFGYVSSKSSSGLLQECSGTIVVNNFNSAGDDMVLYTTTAGANYIYVCNAAKTASKYFKEGYGSAASINPTCSGGSSGTIACSSNSDCGTNGYIGSTSCSGSVIVQDYKTYTCSQPGTVSSQCLSSTEPREGEDCANGCSGGACLGAQDTCITDAEWPEIQARWATQEGC
jgi:hypothetical protein